MSRANGFVSMSQTVCATSLASLIVLEAPPAVTLVVLRGTATSSSLASDESPVDSVYLRDVVLQEEPSLRCQRQHRHRASSSSTVSDCRSS